MIHIPSTDKCIVGDRLEATCKRKPKIQYDDSCGYDKCVLSLHESAWCKIRKECDVDGESGFINKLKRAFDEVGTVFLDGVSINLGKLKCDNCEEPKISHHHGGQHRHRPFKIERIPQYPAISFVDDDLSSEAYAEVAEEVYVR